jgi:hypothetical protein
LSKSGIEITDNGSQAINLILMNSEKDIISFLVQLRSGSIFICEYIVKLKSIELKFHIETGVETFTKFCLLMGVDKISKVIYSSEKEEVLNIITICNSEQVYSVLEEREISLKTNFGSSKNGLISALWCDKNSNYILVAQESSS